MITRQVAASHLDWKFGAKGVNAAFLNGEDGERELVINLHAQDQR